MSNSPSQDQLNHDGPQGEERASPAAEDETEELTVCLMDRTAITRALAAGEVHGLASACALLLGLLQKW